MAEGGVIEQVLRLQDLASPALLDTAKASHAAAEAERAVTLAAKELEAQHHKTAVAVKSMGQASGQLQVQMQTVRFAAMDAANMLLAGASPFHVLMVQGPQAAQALAMGSGSIMGSMKAIGASIVSGIAPALPILGALVAAAAVAATVWVSYKNATDDGLVSTDELNESIRAQARDAGVAADRVFSLKGAWEKFTGIARDAQDQIDLINGKLTENEARARRATEAATEAARGTILVEGQRIIELERAIEVNDALSRSEALGAAERANASAEAVTQREALERLRPVYEGHRAALAATTQALADGAEYADELAAADDREKEAAERNRAATEALEKSKRKLESALKAQAKAYQDAIKAMDEDTKNSAAVLATIEKFQAVVTEAEQAEMTSAEKANALMEERLALLEREYQAALALAATDAERTRLMQAYSAAVQATSTIEEARTRVSGEGAAGAASTAAGGPSAAMQGLSSAGVWGGLIAAIVELVGNLQSVGDAFDEFTRNVFDSIGDIGNTIGDNIERWLTDGTEAVLTSIPKLISGILENLDDILAGIIGSIGAALEVLFGDVPGMLLDIAEMLLSVEFWAGLIGAIVMAIWDAITGVVEAIVDSIADALLHLFGDLLGVDENGKKKATIFEGEWWEQAGEDVSEAFGFATGGYVDRTGLALVHEGERVIPPTGAGTGTATANARGSRGSGITINVTGGVIDPSFADYLVRELNRHLGADGRGLGWAT